MVHAIVKPRCVQHRLEADQRSLVILQFLEAQAHLLVGKHDHEVVSIFSRHIPQLLVGLNSKLQLAEVGVDRGKKFERDLKDMYLSDTQRGSNDEVDALNAASSVANLLGIIPVVTGVQPKASESPLRQLLYRLDEGCLLFGSAIAEHLLVRRQKEQLRVANFAIDVLLD